MKRGPTHRRHRLVLWCTLAAGVVAVAVVLLLLVSAGRSSRAEATCVDVAQQEYPGSDIEVQNVERLGFSSFIVSGSASKGGAAAVEFSCMIQGRSDWIAFSGGEDGTD